MSKGKPSGTEGLLADFFFSEAAVDEEDDDWLCAVGIVSVAEDVCDDEVEAERWC